MATKNTVCFGCYGWRVIAQKLFTIFVVVTCALGSHGSSIINLLKTFLTRLCCTKCVIIIIFDSLCSVSLVCMTLKNIEKNIQSRSLLYKLVNFSTRTDTRIWVLCEYCEYTSFRCYSHATLIQIIASCNPHSIN